MDGGGGVRWEGGGKVQGQREVNKRETHKRGIENKSKEHQILFVDFQELNESRTKICPHGKRPTGVTRKKERETREMRTQQSAFKHIN